MDYFSIREVDYRSTVSDITGFSTVESVTYLSVLVAILSVLRKGLFSGSESLITADWPMENGLETETSTRLQRLRKLGGCWQQVKEQKAGFSTWGLCPCCARLARTIGLYCLSSVITLGMVAAQELILLGHISQAWLLQMVWDKIQWLKKRKKELEYGEGQPRAVPRAMSPRKMISLVLVTLSIIIIANELVT